MGGVVCPPQCAYIFTFLTALNTNKQTPVSSTVTLQLLPSMSASHCFYQGTGLHLPPLLTAIPALGFYSKCSAKTIIIIHVTTKDPLIAKPNEYCSVPMMFNFATELNLLTIIHLTLSFTCPWGYKEACIGILCFLASSHIVS